MLVTRRRFAWAAAGACAPAHAADDPVGPWKSGVRIRPVSTVPGRHTIHTYFNVSPESPDGKHVVFYTSATPEGHAGELRIQERATGKESLLVSGIDCEDGHRVACQQWISVGRSVLFHDMRGGQVVAATVDIATRKERVLARGRMVSWGTADGDWAPIYGVHFQPGPYRDVELLNVRTGEVRTLVAADAVRREYLHQVEELYGHRPISTPFGVLSPDGRKIFFKLAAPADNYVPLPAHQLKWPRRYQSNREGLVCFDIEHSKLLFFQKRWGHPAWTCDSKQILNTPNNLTDADTGVLTRIPDLPAFPGQHLSMSCDGKLFVTDTSLAPFGGAKGEWGVAVCDVRGSSWTMIARFQGAEGATTWRKNHPHPVFSPDGRRIYYNVNAGPFTQLFVAERG